MSHVMRFFLLLFLFTAAASLNSCTTTSTEPESTSDNSLFSISVKDGNGQPVKNLKINVWNYFPLSARKANFQMKVQQVMASNRVDYQLPERSFVTIALYNLDGKLSKELIHDTLNPGYYSILNNFEDGHFNERVHKCLMTATAISSGIILRDSTYLVYWAPDSNAGYLGFTSDKGEFSSNDSLAFPHLFNLPAFNKTSENGPTSIGTFTLSDSIVITVTDTLTGKYMQLTKRMTAGTKSNHFGIVWAPTLSKNGSSVQNNLYKRAINEKSIMNPRDADLTSFACSTNNRDIELTWATATEHDMYRFNVQRSTDQTNFSTIGYVQASGNSNSPKPYSYIDKNLTVGKFYYRLQLVNNDGSSSFSLQVTSTIAMPSSTKLSNCYPNPYN